MNSLVVADKPNGSLHACLDPTDLNRVINYHQYTLPSKEEILLHTGNAEYFTKVDSSNSCWQIPLDEESFKLLTFDTPFGRFRFLRVPCGIYYASEICQKPISEIFEDIGGTSNSQHDIVIWGETPEQLEQRPR